MGSFVRVAAASLPPLHEVPVNRVDEINRQLREETTNLGKSNLAHRPKWTIADVGLDRSSVSEISRYSLATEVRRQTQGVFQVPVDD